MTPARLREIADTLPGYVCGQLLTHADAWERDLADVERFRKLARGYMDERDEARREVDRLAEWLDVAAAAENSNAKELSEQAVSPLPREPFASWAAAYDRAKAMCETAAYIGREPDWSEIDEAGKLNLAERRSIWRAAVVRVNPPKVAT